MTRTLSLFFRRDRLTFEVTSLAPLAIQKTRTYNRFSEAAEDVVDARVYLGIHFRFAERLRARRGNESRSGRSIISCCRSTTTDNHGHGRKDD